MSVRMQLLPYGEQHVLCELADPSDVPGVRAAAAALDGVAEAIAGASTVLVVIHGRTRAQVSAALRTMDAAEPAGADTEPVELPVRYDGPDLDAVAELTGLSSAEVVELHSAAGYTVRFCGFAPGFAYLDGLDRRLHVPRRAEPRTKVPAGAVAIADEFTGVYPNASPGGWRLIGVTGATLWDPARTPPALLVPGTHVRFVPA